MTIDPTIFKAYDIRGIYSTQLTDDLAEKISLAYIKYIKPTEIILGRDGRISGPALHSVVKSTFIKHGVNVIDIGICSSDMYYYACAIKKLPGIMITASHNPKEYNGFKLVRQIPYFLTMDEGIGQIRDLILNNDLQIKVTEIGTSKSWNVMEDFTSLILSEVEYQKFKPFKIVVDPANGMVGPIINHIKNKLKSIEIIPLFFNPDGNFPNHGGDPLQVENRQDIIDSIQKESADFGVMFDPDGDRFFVVDSTGRFISGDFMTAIFSQYFLSRHPGTSIVYDIRASNVVPDTVLKLGGKPLYNRIGHSYIKKRMSDENAIFGGEVSGHYYFADFFYCDSGILSMVYLLDFLSKSTLSLKEIIDDMESKYFISGEINSEVNDVGSVLNKIESIYQDQANQIIKVDGITVEMNDYRFNVRGSNTEPKIRLNLEANSPEIMNSKRDEVLAIIRS